VEWLCEQAGALCPPWALAPRWRLEAPWYDFESPGGRTLAVRARLIETTPAPFARRGIYCGDRVLANKYEFAARFGRRNARGASSRNDRS